MRVQHQPHIDVLSDEYMSSPDKYESFEKMGFEVDPVDAMGGFVPLNRDDKDNLYDAQENIQRRFNLGQTPQGVDPFKSEKR